jgi:predicted RNA binding protein YcfA (HicA-like mRNA interferase family)
MKLPRDLCGQDLATALRIFGYEVVRQRGGRMRLTTQRHGEHHLAIPDRRTRRSGTLSGIINDVAERLNLSRESYTDCSAQGRAALQPVRAGH